MLLGTIIRNLSDPDLATEALLDLDDLALVARIGQAQGNADEAGAYAAAAVARFADNAGDEDWLGLMGKLERSDDPARACLRAMIEWSLGQDEKAQAHGEGCSCGGTH